MVHGRFQVHVPMGKKITYKKIDSGYRLIALIDIEIYPIIQNF